MAYPSSSTPFQRAIAVRRATITVDDVPSPDPGGASHCKYTSHPFFISMAFNAAVTRSSLPS